MKGGNFPVSSDIAAPFSNLPTILLMHVGCHILHLFRVAYFEYQPKGMPLKALT